MSSSKQGEKPTTDSAGLQPAAINVPSIAGDLDFRELMETPEAPSVRGFRLMDKEDMAFGIKHPEREGYPFAIVGIAVREGATRSDGVKGDYVSLECVMADEKTLNEMYVSGRCEVPVANLRFRPGESVVFNDSSTGVRRQIVQWLHESGVINVGAINDVRDFERPYTEWVDGADRLVTGLAGMPLLRCTRGLRYSEYVKEELGPKPVRTWYLA